MAIHNDSESLTENATFWRVISSVKKKHDASVEKKTDNTHLGEPTLHTEDAANKLALPGKLFTLGRHPLLSQTSSF